jgi:hypothetical protein
MVIPLASTSSSAASRARVAAMASERAAASSSMTLQFEQISNRKSMGRPTGVASSEPH